MSFDVNGIEELKAALSVFAGRTLEDAADTQQVIAELIKEKAQDMCPIDYEDLSKSITIRNRGLQRNAGGMFVKGGLRVVEIYVNMNYKVKDPEKLKHSRTGTVGDYAWLVHEHMGWASQPNQDFMPSQKSVEHGLSRGVEAGGKFLERATNELEHFANEEMIKVTRTNI